MKQILSLIVVFAGFAAHAQQAPWSSPMQSSFDNRVNDCLRQVLSIPLKTPGGSANGLLGAAKVPGGPERIASVYHACLAYATLAIEENNSYYPMTKPATDAQLTLLTAAVEKLQMGLESQNAQVRDLTLKALVCAFSTDKDARKAAGCP